MFTLVVLVGKSKQTTLSSLLQANFFSSFSPKSTKTSASKPKETSKDSKNIHEEAK